MKLAMKRNGITTDNLLPRLLVEELEKREYAAIEINAN